MAKKSDSSWFQFESNVACIVTYVSKIIFFHNGLCYVTFQDHFVLRMRIGNLIRIIKILHFDRFSDEIMSNY